MAPSGTWWTTLGPVRVVSFAISLVLGQFGSFLFTFLGVEFAIEDCFYHDAQSALA
jgi:hypothetical protein